MSAFGVMQGANQSLEYNRKLLQKRNKRSFRELRKLYQEEAIIHSEFADTKCSARKTDPRVMESLRAKLRHDRSRDLTIQFLVILVTLAIGFAGLFWVLKYL